MKAMEVGLSVGETPEDLFKKACDGDKAALETLTSLAGNGEVLSMVFLGQLYDEIGPTCIEENLLLARQWYKKSAEKGDAIGQLCFANMCHYGQGGDVDLLSAFKWYLAAAEQGERESQMHVARFYEQGLVGDRNIEAAILWYEKAIENGHELAATNLALILYHPTASDEDYLKAFNLFSFAADKGDGVAHLMLGEMKMRGQGTEMNGGHGLLHFFIAEALLPDGDNRKAASQSKALYLAQHPNMEEQYERRTKEYVEGMEFKRLN